MRVGKELAERHADLVRRYGWDPERLRLLRCELDGVAPYSRRFIQRCVRKLRALRKQLHYWEAQTQAYLAELVDLGFHVPDCCGNYAAALPGWDLLADERHGVPVYSFVQQVSGAEPANSRWVYFQSPGFEPSRPLQGRSAELMPSGAAIAPRYRVLREYTQRPERADDLWVWNRWTVALGQAPARLLRVRGEGYAVEHRDRFGRLHRFHDDGRRREKHG